MMFAIRHLATLGVFAVVATPVVVAQPPMPDDREAHIVCAGRSRPGVDRNPEVRVDRPGKRVTLVLGSRGETTWEVSATNGTSLAKVILIGPFKQTVGDLPKGAERVEAFNDRARRVLGVPDADPAASPSFRRMIQQIHAMTGTEGRNSTPESPCRQSV
jgi:hypothetical protein